MSGITLKLEDLLKITGIKSSSLTTLEELDLSRNKIKYFDDGLFNKLKKLKSLNLSNNLLKTIPENVSCDLSKLKNLNISENSLTTLEFLRNFANLEELTCSLNGLDLSQKFIATCFCPKLQKIDGKTIEKHMKMTMDFKEKLKQLCEKISSEKLSRHNVSSEESQREELLKHVREEKPSIPGLPATIKEFMIKDFCKNFPLTLRAFRSPTKRVPSKSLTPSSPTKRVPSKSLTPSSPTKRVPSKPLTPLSPTKRVQSKSLTPLSPTKRVQSKSLIPSSPRKQFLSPKEQKKGRKAEEGMYDDEKIASKVEALNPCYKPVHFIRCHSGDKKALKAGHSLDDPTDELTNVWCCAFEPHPTDPDKSTGIVATCGGCMVCFIDCGSGQVLKRFNQQHEQFFCLAWTTLKIGNTFSNVLAVSGHNGHLKLIHPSQMICFAEHGNGRPNKSISNFYYSTLLFHPKEKSWLFCSSSDSTVTLFDIGIPSGSDFSTQIKQLTVFNSSPVASVFNIIINEPNGWLVGGTNKGIMIWGVGKDGERSNKIISAGKRKEPIRKFEVSHSSKSQVVDGLTNIDDERFACKFVSHGSIYIFNVNNLSTGPTHILKWHQTDTEFIGINYANGILSCGDDDGSIWLYRVDNLVEEDSLIEISKEPVTPFKILPWPECKIDEKNPNDAKMVDVLEQPEPLITNCLTMDSKAEFLISTNDCNIVSIWRHTSRKFKI